MASRDRMSDILLIYHPVLQASTTITFLVGIFAVHAGIGNHVYIVEESGQLKNLLIWAWVTVSLFNVALPLGKIAVSAFLLEILGNARTYSFSKTFVQNGRHRNMFKSLFWNVA